MSVILQLCLSEYIKERTLLELDLESFINTNDSDNFIKFNKIKETIDKIVIIEGSIERISKYIDQIKENK